MPTPRLALALLALPLPARAQEVGWPHFLGPNRDGVTSESGWSTHGKPEPLWRRNVGAGYSCPSIVPGHLVTMGYDAEGERDLVWCLDPATGDELWVHAYAATDSPSYHGGGTLTTPAIAGATVYTVNRHGLAFALELATGDVVWQQDYRAELALPETFHGYCASPVVFGDRILYVFGGTAVVARRDGGAVIWQSDDHGDGAYSNPTVFERDGEELAAVMLGQDLYVLDLQDGRIVHELPWPLTGMAVHVAQPLVVGDRLLVSTAYGKGSAMLRLGDEREPEVLWTSRRLRNKVTGVYLHDEHLYGFDESMLKCFDLDGNERWRVRGLGMGALSIAGGRLLVLSSKGELIVAAADPDEFRELSRTRVLEGGSYWTMPVLVDGRIYVRNSLGDLACLDHRADAAADFESASAGEAPDARELFAAHARDVGAERIRRARGLELVGTWAIPGRGQAPTPARWTFHAPNAWRLELDSGGRVHTFDGEVGWELLNGQARLFEGAEADEAPFVGCMVELFAPTAPDGARTLSEPEPFLGRPCWVVASEEPSEEASDGRALRTYFAVDTGRLVGRAGERASTMAFDGRRTVGDARVPERITIYRVDNGQEETFHVSEGTWVDEAPPAFERSEALRRLLRSPEEIARDEEALRERYGELVGRYATGGPDDPEVIAIAIQAGDLVFEARGSQLTLLPRDGEPDAFEVSGVGATLRIVRDDAGLVTGADLELGARTIHHERRDD